MAMLTKSSDVNVNTFFEDNGNDCKAVSKLPILILVLVLVLVLALVLVY